MRWGSALAVFLIIDLLIFACGVEETTIVAPPDTVPPAKVTDLAAGSPTDSSLLLTWTAPGDDSTEGTASRYEILQYEGNDIDCGYVWITEIDSVPQPLPAGSVESLVVFGLDADSTYYYSLRAADEDSNWSGYSNLAMGHTTSGVDSIPPAPVTNLRIIAKDTMSVTLAWTAPGDDDTVGTAAEYAIRHFHSAINDYTWYLGTPVDSVPSPQPAGTSETFRVGGLASDSLYHFSLRTMDEANNWSGFSNDVQTRTSTEPDYFPPDPIVDLHAAEQTHSSITIAWSAPADQPDSVAVFKYDIRYSQDSLSAANFLQAMKPTNIPLPEAPGTAQSYTIGGLDSATQYYIAMKCTDDYSNWSELSNVLVWGTDSVSDTTTLDRTPPGRVTDLRVVDSSLTSLTIAWTAPGDDGYEGQAVGYIIKLHDQPMWDGIGWEYCWCDQECDPDYEVWQNLCANEFWCEGREFEGPDPAPAGTTESLTVDGLDSNTVYYVYIKAVDDAGLHSGMGGGAYATTANGTD